MRLIVIGDVRPQPDSTLKGDAWFRYPVAKERQQLYAELQSKSQPEAPGDYAAAHAAEVTAFQNGEFVEHRVGDDARFDPAAGVATMQKQIARMYELAAAHFEQADDERLAFHGSSFDGTTWEMHSA